MTRSGSQTDFELDFIRRLFSKFELIEVFTDGNLDRFAPNAVVVVSSNKNRTDYSLVNYLKEYEIRGSFFYLYHLSNESCDQIDFANNIYPMARKVFRTYYCPEINKAHYPIHMPLGYQSGTMQIPPKKKCINQSNFIGSMKADRQKVVSQLKKIGDSVVMVTTTFNDPEGVDLGTLQFIHNNSRFVPCPSGHVHAESFRFGEVLMSGSLPVITKNMVGAYRVIYGNELEKMCYIVDDWGDLLKLKNMSDRSIYKLKVEAQDVYIGFLEKLSERLYYFFKREKKEWKK